MARGTGRAERAGVAVSFCSLCHVVVTKLPVFTKISFPGGAVRGRLATRDLGWSGIWRVQAPARRCWLPMREGRDGNT